MAINWDKYGLSEELGPLGSWLVYIAYIILFTSIFLSRYTDPPEPSIYQTSVDYSRLILLTFSIISLLLIFLIAPVLQIIGIYHIWFQKYPEEPAFLKRKKIRKRILACGAYALNLLAFTFLILLFTLS